MTLLLRLRARDRPPQRGARPHASPGSRCCSCCCSSSIVVMRYVFGLGSVKMQESIVYMHAMPVHGRGRLHAAAQRPRALRHLLQRRLAADQGAGRPVRGGGVPAADLRADRLGRLALRRRRLGGARGLARGQPRHPRGVPAQDRDPGLRRPGGAAGPRARDPFRARCWRGVEARRGDGRRRAGGRRFEPARRVARPRHVPGAVRPDPDRLPGRLHARRHGADVRRHRPRRSACSTPPSSASSPTASTA